MKQKNINKLKKIGLITIVTIILLCLFSCAESQPYIADCVIGHKYGFWGGLWHGVIAPFSFFASLVNDNVAVWAVNNNGAWYTFGFIFGVGGFAGLVGSR